MGELTASLAHELNHRSLPLPVMPPPEALFGARFSRSEMFGELLDDVFSDARRAGAVIHGIHQLVRKGKKTGAKSVNDLILEVLRLMHSDLLGRSTTSRRIWPPSFRGYADPVRLQQVFLNLIIKRRGDCKQRPLPAAHFDFLRGRDGYVRSAWGSWDRPSGGNPDKIFSILYDQTNGMGRA